jgi:hypothetical protein
LLATRIANSVPFNGLDGAASQRQNVKMALGFIFLSFFTAKKSNAFWLLAVLKARRESTAPT